MPKLSYIFTELEIAQIIKEYVSRNHATTSQELKVYFDINSGSYSSRDQRDNCAASLRSVTVTINE